jgi:hypothetical protein
MDLSVPDESAVFAKVVADWAKRALADDSRAWSHTHALDGLGVFQLVGDEAVDPDHQHLNASLVLEQLALAGMRGPLAETMWAAAHAGHDVAASGWVGAVLPVEREGARLVPYGQHVDLVLDGSSPARVRSVSGLSAAYLPLSEGAAWFEGPATSLEEVDGAFAWMAYASLTLGYCERLIDLALLQTKDRQAFGTSLLTFQAPRFALVEAYQLVAGVRGSVRDVAWRLDQGQAGATALAAASWLLAADVSRRVATNVHQVMGAASFPRETGVTPTTGAMAILRLGNGTARAANTLWSAWRTAAPDRPSNVGGVLSPTIVSGASE